MKERSHSTNNLTAAIAVTTTLILVISANYFISKGAKIAKEQMILYLTAKVSGIIVSFKDVKRGDAHVTIKDDTSRKTYYINGIIYHFHNNDISIGDSIFKAPYSDIVFVYTPTQNGYIYKGKIFEH